MGVIGSHRSSRPYCTEAGQWTTVGHREEEEDDEEKIKCSREPKHSSDR